MTSFETFINRDLLRYAVSQAITCFCGKVLDANQAVSITVMADRSRAVKSITVCATCWDLKRNQVEAETTKRGYTLEVLDGRQLEVR